MTTQKTALYEKHVGLGAQMVDFKNTWLPVRFQSELDEHEAVRRSVGVFDVSHMGEFMVVGKYARPFLQRLLTNNIDKLSAGHAQYSLMLNKSGGIVDDLIVYCLDDERYLLCVNAGNIERDWHHVIEHASEFEHCDMSNVSADYSQLAVQGPHSEALLQTLSKEAMPEKFRIKAMKLFDFEALVARTGYSGSDGFEIFVKNDHIAHLYDLLMARGHAFGVRACGLAARDSLRIEAGLLLHGQDMDETLSPTEAGLLFAVDLKKPDFVGKVGMLAKVPDRKLVGFKLIDKGLARHGYSVLNNDLETIGCVTSATYLSDKKLAIGFALVRAHEYAKGNHVRIDIRGRTVAAELCSTRFITL